MEAEAIVTLISNMGFPIACAVAMFVMWDKERREHKAESEKWTEAINNNTRVMERILDKLGGVSDAA